VRTFKAAATKRINEHRGSPGVSVWQRNYYERVIRDEAELARARQYILDNPAKWAEDKHNPVNFSNRQRRRGFAV
jgi:REP element-mobilizing transposase RayT